MKPATEVLRLPTALVEQLRSEGRAAFGVAPSAAAADVLASETGIAADTIDKLLTEHSLQRPPDHRYNLPTGTTVIVDEAAMVPGNHNQGRHQQNKHDRALK